MIGQEVGLLNYVIIGEVRSGSTVVQSSLCNRKGAVCHGELFHPDIDIRRAAHEAYYGAARAKNAYKLPEWFVEGTVSPWQYINHTIFDNPHNGESAVGFRILYPDVHKWELYDLFEVRCREGDFCVVHVVRNPVACFVSLKQAEKSGVWTCNDSKSSHCPFSVSLNAGELIEFCRKHFAIRGKLKAACSDMLEISYSSLFVDYQDVMRKVFDFLELPDSEEPASTMHKRLRNRPMQQRITNWNRIREEVPSDILKLFDAEDFC